MPTKNSLPGDIDQNFEASGVPVTQQLIAERLNVSQRAVSYVLNGKGNIGKKTRERVLQEAERMGYQPNKAAVALATGRSNIISLHLPYVASLYFLQVITALQKVAEGSPYNLVITTGKNPLRQWPVDGYLLLDQVEFKDEKATPDVKDLISAPTVAMGTYPYLAPETQDYAGYDMSIPARQMLEHLYSKGCQRIAFIASEYLFWDEEPRYANYQKFISEAGLKREEIVVTDGPMIRQNSGTALKAYIEANGCPDGLYCGNDDVAIGVCRSLRELGITVPHDVKVTGCDNIIDAINNEPSLSTIELPVEQMCQLAWDMLMRRLQNHNIPTQRENLLPRCVFRESSQ